MILDEIVENEIKILKEVEEILDTERDILIKNEGQELLKIIEKKQKAALNIRDLEKNRIKLCNGKSAQDCVNNNQLDKTIYKNLIKAVDIIRQKSDTNMALTKQSLTYIKVITNLLTPKQPIVKYGQNGQVGDNRESGLFTTKA